LGFTHYCGRRHKTGTFTVWRITAKTRMAATLKVLKVELRCRMHERPAKTGAWLRKVVFGYYQYHSVPGTRHSHAAVNERADDGKHSFRCSIAGYLARATCIHIPKFASTPSVLHKSRMRRRARTDPRRVVP
jgi:hypothetical protein